MIKGQIAAILNLEDPSTLAIILAGRELSNEVRVRDCDLGQQTILHAVKVVQKSTPKPPLNEDLLDLQLTGKLILNSYIPLVPTSSISVWTLIWKGKC